MQAVSGLGGELIVIDADFIFDGVDVGCDGFLERLDEGVVSSRVVERLSLYVKGRKTAVRDHYRHWGGCRSEPRRYTLSYFGVLLRGCSHERHARIVNMKFPVLKFRGDCIGWPEVDHVESPETYHLRNSRTRRRSKAVRASAENAADQFVCELGRREVEHSRNHACLYKVFHGSAASPRSVEDEHFVTEMFETLPRSFDSRRRYPKHRGADDGFRIAGFDSRVGRHPGDRARSVRQDAA